MRISFDLDGVIADTDRWFFRMLNSLQFLQTSKELLDIMELDYYSSRPVKFHPNFFMTPDDIGFIITSRRPLAIEATQSWLDTNHITLPIIYSDHNGDIDWTNYEKASLIAGKYKAKIIRKHNIEVHFDNNPYIVEVVRKMIPSTNVILVGGR